jgi:hypothetical protein
MWNERAADRRREILKENWTSDVSYAETASTSKPCRRRSAAPDRIEAIIPAIVAAAEEIDTSDNEIFPCH